MVIKLINNIGNVALIYLAIAKVVPGTDNRTRSKRYIHKEGIKKRSIHPRDLE